MRYELNVEPDAENDVTESSVWYNEQKAGLGNEFLEAVEAELEKVQRDPFIYAIRYRQTRVVYIKRFPFGIHFNIDKNRINVLAILHTSRNPKIWNERAR